MKRLLFPPSIASIANHSRLHYTCSQRAGRRYYLANLRFLVPPPMSYSRREELDTTRLHAEGPIDKACDSEVKSVCDGIDRKYIGALSLSVGFHVHHTSDILVFIKNRSQQVSGTYYRSLCRL